MRDGNLDGRLRSMADFVRQGAVFADIGTDHGYLPVFLLKEGRISRAVLTDVNEGPLATAVSNVREAELEDRVTFLLTDGAAALSGLGVTDVAICGMGAELICRIISEAPCLYGKGIRLILQPMSKASFLRKFLFSEGFDVLEETYSSVDGKSYVGILAEYTGVVKEISDVDAELGLPPRNAYRVSEYLKWLERKLPAFEKAIEGRRTAALPTGQLSGLKSAVQKRIEEIRGGLPDER